MAKPDIGPKPVFHTGYKLDCDNLLILQESFIFFKKNPQLLEVNKMSTTRIAICLFDESIKEFNAPELMTGSTLRQVDITDPGNIKAVLFVRESDPASPEWMDIVGNFANLGYLNLKTSSSGAILFIKIGKRIIGCCFGSSVANINRNNIETDFGLGVAYNKMGLDQTKSIESLTLADNPITNTRSATLPTNRFSFNVDRYLESITELSGYFYKDSRRTLIKGKEFYSETAPSTLKDISELCKTSLNAYNISLADATFKELTAIRKIKDNKEIERLDKNLCDAIKAKSSNLYVVDYENFDNLDGYKLTLKGEKFSELTNANVLERFNTYTEITADLLKNRRIFPVSQNEENLANWSVYKCIFYTDAKSKCILYKGKWYDIDNKYLQGLKTFVQSHETPVPAFIPWNGTDDEGNYNLKAAKRLGGQCWDKSLYRTTEYKHGIEFCDILFENHVIHVKKYESSALNSHLLMQTAVSAQLLSTDMNLKKWIKQKREEKFSDKHLIDDNLALINEEVIYVILLLSKRKGRLCDILPFFSLISFNIVIKRIVQLGYVVKVAKTN